MDEYGYVIETLEIELNKCREAKRIEEKYSVYPEYKDSKINWAKRIYYLEAAINKIKELI